MINNPSPLPRDYAPWPTLPLSFGSVGFLVVVRAAVLPWPRDDAGAFPPGGKGARVGSAGVGMDYLAAGYHEVQGVVTDGAGLSHSRKAPLAA